MRCQFAGYPLPCLTLLLQLCWLTDVAWAQRSAYSLQAALDELHRRDSDAAKYPLNAPPSQRFLGSALVTVGNEQDYWDEDTAFPANNPKTQKNRNRHRLNKALAKYLERETYDADHGGPLSVGPFGGYEFDDEDENYNLQSQEKKRVPASLFRERDNKYENPPSTSVFRERETPPPGPGVEPHPQAELTEQFLREIEEASEHERKERYKEALRHLWEKYQQQENDVDSNIFEEKKRMRMPPYYMLMQKKRSYPVLPWLPYSADKKKRFPVAKRSTTRTVSEPGPIGKPDEKLPKELRELFGESPEEKKKRSTDEQVKAIATTFAPVTQPALVNMRIEGQPTQGQVIAPNEQNVSKQAATNGAEGDKEVVHHAGYHVHDEKEHKHRKRSDNAHHLTVHSIEDSEEEGEQEHEHEHEHEHEDSSEDSDEDDHDEFDEDDEEERRKKKKKRDALLKLAEPQEAEMQSMLRSKKSIDWSKYFGLDRKKKSTNAADLDMKKRSSSNADDAEADQGKKTILSSEKLESMDKKLQAIEDFIIDETIKYTGAHEGITSQDEVRRLKDHVLSRLATAYSLEKMRRALDKLRQSVENDNHLLRNVIEPDSQENDLENWQSSQKRVAYKKDKAELHDAGHEVKIKPQKINNAADNNAAETNESEVQKKKKRNGYLRYPDLPNDVKQELAVNGPAPYESFNDAYLGNKNYMIGSNQCPLIESMAERCRGVDMLSGDLNQELLPICGVHQICYLCGTSQIACDYQYLAEADNICGSDNDCQAAARSVLMILRGSPGPQLGPRECLKNSCLYSAMREIGL